MTERKRYACDRCPAFFGTGGDYDPEYSTDRNGRRRRLASFTYYCRPTEHSCRKLAHKADYTGNQPKWCPRLQENQTKEETA